MLFLGVGERMGINWLGPHSAIYELRDPFSAVDKDPLESIIPVVIPVVSICPENALVIDFIKSSPAPPICTASITLVPSWLSFAKKESFLPDVENVFSPNFISLEKEPTK